MKKSGLACLLAVVFLLSNWGVALGQWGLWNDPYEFVVLLKAEPLGSNPGSLVDDINQGQAGLSSLVGKEPESAKLLVSARSSGSSLARIISNPNQPDSRLQRYVSLRFDGSISPTTVLNSLNSDSEVEEVLGGYLPVITFGSVPNDPLFSSQWHLTNSNLGVQDAWAASKGTSLISILDVGLETTHPDLRAFSGSSYTGGALRTHLSQDLGNPVPGECGTSVTSDGFDPNIDTLEVEASAMLFVNCATPGFGTLVPDPDNCVTPLSAGHGTHVSGIAAATANNSVGVSGVCQGCSLSFTRIAYLNSNGSIRLHSQRILDAIVRSIQNGTEVISKSIGILPSTDCAQFESSDLDCLTGATSLDPWCDALDFAENRDVVVVASAGNNGRGPGSGAFANGVAWPAREANVWGVGGVDSSLNIWDEKDKQGQTYPPGVNESGTTYGPSIDFMAPARHILSSAYTSEVWIPLTASPPLQPCGDQAPSGSPSTDGYGECTGTSMSAPFVAGVASLLRSTNPLLLKSELYGVTSANAIPVGDCPSPVLNCGEGIPDAGSVVENILGLSNGTQILNRLTPMFSIRSNDAQNLDYFQSASPQMILAMSLDRSIGYDSDPNASAITGGQYPMFLKGEGDGGFAPTPVADFYVLTGYVDPFSGQDDLVPLYRLSKPRSSGPDDHRYATDVSTMESYVAAGWRLDKIEGYLFPPDGCSGCAAPVGTVAVKQKRRLSPLDHGLFISSDSITGYSNYGSVLGYAYPNVDADNDGLIDGSEDILGTSSSYADSDCDGIEDGSEYPHAGVPGDPLDQECVDIEVTVSQGNPFNHVILHMVNNGPSVATNASFEISYGVLPGGGINLGSGISSTSSGVSCYLAYGDSDGEGWECDIGQMDPGQVNEAILNLCSHAKVTVELDETNGVPDVDQIEIVSGNNRDSMVINGGCGI